MRKSMLNEGHDEYPPRTLHLLWARLAEREDQDPLVLVDDLDRRVEEGEDHHRDEGDDRDRDRFHWTLR
jgi:hypothetical protein